MTARTIAFLLTLAALSANTASPGMAAPAKSTGHTPHPVQDIGPTDLFHGYRCGGGDCRLHQQGYEWGAVHKIVNPRDCRGTSEEFIEGCRAFTGIDGPLGVREIFQDED